MVNFPSVRNYFGLIIGAVVGWVLGGFVHVNVGILFWSIDIAPYVGAFIGGMLGEQFVWLGKK